MTDALDDSSPRHLLTEVAMLLDRAASMVASANMACDPSSSVVEPALLLGIDLARAQAAALLPVCPEISIDLSARADWLGAGVDGASQLLLRAERLLAAGCLGPDGSLPMTQLHVDVLDLLRECQRAGR